MLALYDISTKFLTIITNLIGLKSTLEKASLEKRTRIADYLDKIADCLKTISQWPEDESLPYGPCGELHGYVNSLQDILKGVIGEDKAREYVQVLSDADWLRGVYFLGTDEEVGPEQRGQLQKAMGEFRALANTLRI